VSETVKYSPKCRGNRRIDVAIIDIRLFIGHCIRTMFTTFTKVADFLVSSQFLALLGPVIDSGSYPKKFRGSNAPVPNTNSLSGLSSRPPPTFLLHPSTLLLHFHASFLFSLPPTPRCADFLKKNHGQDSTILLLRFPL
jgi:hypothetical protein